jgi:hypothetical protein
MYLGSGLLLFCFAVLVLVFSSRAASLFRSIASCLRRSGRGQALPGFEAVARQHTELGDNPMQFYVQLVMQIVVSVVILSAALYLILSQRYDVEDKHWAYGAAGAVVGYWLKR